MSQVKKLKSGGIPKYSEGSIIIDGREYKGDNAIQAFGEFSGREGGEEGILGSIWRALRDGYHMTYTSGNNLLVGLPEKYLIVQDGVKKHLQDPDESIINKKLQATFNHGTHLARKELSKLPNFHYEESGSDSTVKPNLIPIGSNELWFNYSEGENPIYLQNGKDNNLIKQRLESFSDYLYDEAKGKEKYSLDDWYNQDNNLDAIKALYKSYITNIDWRKQIKDIISRAESGNLTDEDKAFLKHFNIIEPKTTPVDDGSSGDDSEDIFTPEERAKWKQNGWSDDLMSIYGPYTKIYDDGSIGLRDGYEWNWDFGKYNGKNIYFNDDFYKLPMTADGSYDQLRGLTLYNGRLYTLNNPTLNKIVTAPGGYNDLMRKGDWDAAQDIIATRFTDAALLVPKRLDNSDYSPFMDENPDRRFASATGLFSILNENGERIAELPDGQQIWQYVDLNNPEYDGPYTRYKYKYALIDRYGKKLRDIDSSELQEIVNGQPQGYTSYKQIYGTGNKAFDEKYYYYDFTTSDGKDTGFRIYMDKSGDSDTIILHMPEIRGAGIKSQDLQIPKEFMNFFVNRPDIWGNIVKDPRTARDFVKLMSSLVQSDFRQITSTGFFLNSDKNRNFFEKIGFTPQEAEVLLNYLTSYAERNTEGDLLSRYDRRTNHLVTVPVSRPDINIPQVESQKNGGRVAIRPLPRKFQDGGASLATTTGKGVSEYRLDVGGSNYRNANTLSDLASGKWEPADTKDMLALIADLTSLGLSFSPDPYTNVGSMVSGMTGSFARFAANRDRSTKGAGKQLAVDLGVDLAMLLPFANSGIKSANLVKAIRHSLPVLMKSASYFGLGTAFANTAIKIANGEDFTLRDISVIVNGLTSAVSLGKIGKMGKNAGLKKDFAPVEFKGKVNTDGTPIANVKDKIPIEYDQFKDIKTPEQFKNRFVEIAKQWDPDVTPENVESRYDLSEVIEPGGKKWKPNWNIINFFRRRNVPETYNKPDRTKKPREYTAEELQEMPNWLKRKRGVGEYKDLQAEYRRQLEEGPDWVKVKSVKSTEKFVPVETDKFAPQTVRLGSKELTLTGEQIGQIEAGTLKLEDVLNHELPAESKNAKNWIDAYNRIKKTKVLEYKLDQEGSTTEKIPAGKRKKGEDIVSEQTEPLSPSSPVSLPVKVKTIIQNYYTNQGIARPQFIVPWQLEGNEYQQPADVVYNPYYKKGGILKAQNGRGVRFKNYSLTPNVNFSDIVSDTYDTLANAIENYAAHYDSMPEGESTSSDNSGSANSGSTNTEAPVERVPFTSLDVSDKARETLDPSYKKELNTVIDPNKDRKLENPYLPKEEISQAPYIGGAFKGKMRINPNLIANTIGAGISSALTEKQYRNWLKRPLAWLTAPIINSRRHIDTGEGNYYREKAKKYLTVGPATTSDTIKDKAWRYQMAQNADEAEREASLADSRSYAQTLADNYDIYRENKLRSTDFANQNNQNYVNYATSNILQKNSAIAEKSRFWDAARYANLQIGNEEYDTKQALLGQEAAVEGTSRARANYIAAMDNWEKKYPTEESRNTLQARLDRNAIYTDYENDLQRAQLVGERTRVGLAAKGGKVGKESKVSYTRDPYPDLLLQNAKESQRAVAKLSDAVIALIKQTRPIYVSK